MFLPVLPDVVKEVPNAPGDLFPEHFVLEMRAGVGVEAAVRRVTYPVPQVGEHHLRHALEALSDRGGGILDARRAQPRSSAKIIDAVQAIADAVQPAAEIHREMAAQLKEALEQEDSLAATKVKKAMWDALFPIYKDLFSMTSFWNDLATR